MEQMGQNSMEILLWTIEILWVTGVLAVFVFYFYIKRKHKKKKERQNDVPL